MAELDSAASKYQILKKLAVGGMAEIFLARAASVAGVERYCVLKRILDHRAADKVLVQMFVDEARLVARLQHPNIASVYDFGTLGDSYFFTMEYVHGETVRSMFDRITELQRPMPLGCVLTIIAGAASGLHHAHERNASDGRPLGIVHRDVSPSNLMVSYEGHVKLVDFGVAKAADRANETSAGTVKGKIGYLSPEQCRNAPLDRRSDLFSLGIVMWEVLTAQRLYRREGNFDNMTAIVTEPPPPPSTFRPDLPREIDDLVLRLLAKAPSERFQSAAELVEAIERAAMRAGEILSTAAVSRLVHELFGARVEPWLEPDLESMLSDVVTVASRPITDELQVPGVVGEVDEPQPSVRSSHPTLTVTGEVVSPTPVPEPPSPEDAPTVVVAPIVAEPASDLFVATGVLARAPELDATASTVEIAVLSPSSEITPLLPPRVEPYGIAGPGALTGGPGSRPRGARRMPWALVGVIANVAAIGLGLAWCATYRAPPRVVPRSAGAALVLDAASDDGAVASVVPPVAPVIETPTPAPTGPPPSAADPEQISFESLSASYEARDYQSVVTACSRAATTTGVTTICMMAACHLGDAVQAERWLSAHPPARRTELAASCAQAGNVELEVTGAPSTTPAAPAVPSPPERHAAPAGRSRRPGE